MHCFCNFNSINSNLSNRIELTPKDLQKSVGVISLLSAYQIFALTDSRGRLSLQNRCKLPCEKQPFGGELFFSGRYHKRYENAELDLGFCKLTVGDACVYNIIIKFQKNLDK